MCFRKTVTVYIEKPHETEKNLGIMHNTSKEMVHILTTRLQRVNWHLSLQLNKRGVSCLYIGLMEQLLSFSSSWFFQDTSQILEPHFTIFVYLTALSTSRIMYVNKELYTVYQNDWCNYEVIIFVSMLNRITKTGKNEGVTLWVHNTYPKVFDVCTLGHTAHIQALV
jgi:hypothetical protein